MDLSARPRRWVESPLMTFVDVLEAYFRGEKQLGIALAVVGFGLVAGALWVLRTQVGGFAVGLAVPLSIVGLGLGGGGVYLAIRTEHQVAALTANLDKDPRAVYSSELTRMAKVNANWPRLKMAWAVLTVIAMTMVVAAKKEWAHGVGLAVMLATTILFFTDVFAERRARVYTEGLERERAGGGG